MGTDSDGHSDVETLERGDLWFFYRPRVEEEDPEGVEDVQRFYLVLSPDDRDRYRLAIVGRKQLPRPERHGRGRYWAFIDLVRKDPKAILEALGPETYQTKTRGERHQPAARPVGEGRYRILRHGDHTHFVYALELPEQLGPVQEDLRIEEDASYIISIANPQRRGDGNGGPRPRKEASYPKDLQERFRDRRFAEADPPRFLDQEGAEFVLISAHEDVEEELGLRLATEEEDEQSADIFGELRVDRQRHPLRPLFEGEWE